MRAIALAILLPLALAAPTAAKQASVDRAVRCLERQPVCVDPGAGDTLSRDDARDLADQSRNSGEALSVAALADEGPRGASSAARIDKRIAAAGAGNRASLRR